MIKNLKRSSVFGEIARFNLVPPTRKVNATFKFNKVSLLMLPILFLFAFQSISGQVALEKTVMYSSGDIPTSFFSNDGQLL